MGFRYPQHFTRLFKQKVGMSPNEYRNARANELGHFWMGI